MSAFLGPIHYLLFDKIKFQNGLCDYLLNNADSKDSNFLKEVNDNTSSIPEGTLENIVDLSNIHGSLQSMIKDIEYRLAYIVDRIQKKEIFSFEEILKLSNEYGKTIDVDRDISPVEAYTILSSKLLNGMPCDRVQEILGKDEDFVSWRDRIDIHEEFWRAVQRDSSEFYEIRSSIIKGILEKTNLRYEEKDSYEYLIRRA